MLVGANVPASSTAASSRSSILHRTIAAATAPRFDKLQQFFHKTCFYIPQGMGAGANIRIFAVTPSDFRSDSCQCARTRLSRLRTIWHDTSGKGSHRSPVRVPNRAIPPFSESGVVGRLTTRRQRRRLETKEGAPSGSNYRRYSPFNRPARAAAEFLLSLLPMKETSERTANKPLIFLTNDDGVNAKGLRMLIETLRQEARLLVVAPEQAQSGMGHAITLTRPLYLKKITDEPGLSVYACNGTPVDCVKIAFDCMMLGKEMPSLVVSGINHGSNSAINVLYSGTMGAAIEGGFYDIPSIGFSLLDHDEDADFSAALSYVRPIIERAMNSDTLGRPLCLNVNVPNLPADRIKGIKACRAEPGLLARGVRTQAGPEGTGLLLAHGLFSQHGARSAGYRRVGARSRLRVDRADPSRPDQLPPARADETMGR